MITARSENNNNYNCWYGRCRYTSARLLTAGKFSQKYGAIEARMKIPKGNGIWPAFWMLGDDLPSVGWPQCGEIDIMENIGKEPRAVHGTLHGPGYSGGDGLGSTYNLPNNQAFGDAFHTYRVDWTASSISFSVDGHQYATKRPADTHGKKWVFDHNFFMIMNVAVGGGWPGPPDSSTVFPQSLVVDYVKVYSKDRQGQIKGIGERCVGIFEAAFDNSTTVHLNHCSSAEEWTFANDSSIRINEKCLHVVDGDMVDETLVKLEDCNGSESQIWTVSSTGDIVNRNKCLDTRELTTGMFLQVLDCNGSPSQKWTLPLEEVVV